jgi:hypothetical protein
MGEKGEKVGLFWGGADGLFFRGGSMNDYG